MTRILITGFGAFPGAAVNPTQAIVHGLATRHRRSFERAGIDLRTAVLPVAYSAVEPAIHELLREFKPDIVIHLGLAGRRENISIETRARNRLSIIHPDAVRCYSPHMAIEKGGSQTIAARWPAERLAVAATRHGFAAKRSIDAGDYLCNQALYISLQQHRGLCGFIHVPRLQAARRESSSTLPRLPDIQELERSVLAAARLLAVEHRRASRLRAG